MVSARVCTTVKSLLGDAVAVQPNLYPSYQLPSVSKTLAFPCVGSELTSMILCLIIHRMSMAATALAIKPNSLVDTKRSMHMESTRGRSSSNCQAECDMPSCYDLFVLIWSFRLLVRVVGQDWGFIYFSICVYHVVYYITLLYACGCDVPLNIFLVIVSVSNRSRVFGRYLEPTTRWRPKIPLTSEER